ncbi:VC0807 family protein [Bdellovibrionota bacterium FG-2]
MNPQLNPKSQIRMLLLGGVLPVVAFTVIEEVYGTLAGLAAGMIFGVGEIIWEWLSQRRVDAITWGGNGMLLLLGAVSLFTKEGLWFKLQPAILEAVMGGVLFGSVVLGRPLLLALAEKQGLFQQFPLHLQTVVVPLMKRSMRWMCIRIGVFLWLHAVVATWAALYATTAVWAMLKGVGFTVSFIVFVGAESLVLRRRIQGAVRG